MLSVTYSGCHIKALNAERRYAECYYVECNGATCKRVSENSRCLLG
jgi:hypothetical protein